MLTNESPITILPPGGGEHLDVLGSRTTVKSDHAQGRMFFAEQPLPPGFASPVHSHTDEDEIVFVLSGEIVLFDGKQDITAGPGTFAYIPRGAQHGLSNPFEAPATILAITSPGGKLGAAFRGFDKAASDAKGPVSPATLGAICAANGMVVRP